MFCHFLTFEQKDMKKQQGTHTDISAQCTQLLRNTKTSLESDVDVTE